jgi:ATP-binding cassette subfamily F protein uup
LKDFLFKPEQAQMPVSSLSGGEKNRLMLAVALAKESNLLILDEPTNDLDMDTLDLLQETLDEYRGTVLLVSHDRDFLDKVATSVIYMKGDGTVEEYADSCSEVLKKHWHDRLPHSSAAISRSAPSIVMRPKLSYNQQRLLEVLPGEIAAMEEKVKEIEGRLSDSELYTKTPEEFDRLAKELEELKHKIGESEEKWLELDSLRQTF